MSDTPRADAFLLDYDGNLKDISRFARELERENTALKQRIIDDNKAYGCEIRDPSGTIWEHAQKLQKENAELRKAAAITDDYINQMLHGDIELPHGILQSWRDMNNAARNGAKP